MAVWEQNGTATRNTAPNHVFETPILWPWKLVDQPTWLLLPWLLHQCLQRCRISKIRIGSSGQWVTAVLLFWQASIIPATSTGEKHAHTSPSLPVAAGAPFSRPTSPADTIHQRPPKSNAANWKVMTAKGLLDLHANSSILASHGQTTGKMRLCTSFQTISCLLLHSTHAYTHTHILSLGVCCPEAKNQLEIALHELSEKPAKNCKGQHVFVLLLGQGCKLQL